MKYTAKEYLTCGFYDGDMDCDIEQLTQKIVKCRKPHKCMAGCESEIQPGEHAFLETGFTDGKPVSSYTCTPCLDKWIEELKSLSED